MALLQLGKAHGTYLIYIRGIALCGIARHIVIVDKVGSGTHDDGSLGAIRLHISYAFGGKGSLDTLLVLSFNSQHNTMRRLLNLMFKRRV